MTRRASLLAGLAPAAALAVAMTATPAAAATDPGFLDASNLPKQTGVDWFAGPVTAGTPDPLPFCYGQSLPGATSVHRAFWTDLDTSAVQVTIVERDEQRAKDLAALLNKAVRTCASRTQAQDPGTTARYRSLGHLKVEEGVTLHGVRTSTESSKDVHLFAVGRDGRTVTVVSWGRMGTFADAPVPAFKQTAREAVRKLY